MSTGVIITLIICVTLISLSVISQDNKTKKYKRKREDETSKEFETPENNDLFKLFKED